MAQPLTKVG